MRPARRPPLPWFAVIAAAAVLACGTPNAPTQDDACRNDDGCASGLICCHSTDDTVPSGDRGFCVKRSVCAKVDLPSPPSMPPPEE